MIALIEREAHQGKLIRLFRDCQRGSGRVALLTGTPGVGKTALLEAFMEWCSPQGAITLSAAGSQAEQTQEFGVLRQLLDQAHRVTGQLTPVITPGDVATPQARGTAHDGPGSLSLAQDLAATLLRLADRSLLVLAIDDVQFSDPASLDCLLRLVRRVRSVPIMVVLSVCQGLPPADPGPLLDLRGYVHCHRIQLEPLSRAGVGALVGHALDRPDPELAQELHEATGGNPLLVNALLEDHITGSAMPRSGGPGHDAFTQAVARCLWRLEESTVRVAQTLAALSELSDPVTCAVLGRVVGAGQRALGRDIKTLEQLGLTQGGRYHHTRTSSAVLDGMATADRAELHERIAVILHQDHAPPREVARHLVAARRVRKPWLIDILEEAAEQSLADGDRELALDCLRMAQDSCTDPRRTPARAALLMGAEWWGSPAVAVRHLDPLLEAVQDGRLQGRRGLVLIDHLLWHGRLDDARAVAGALEEEGPPDPQSGGRHLCALLTMFYAFPRLRRTLSREDSEAFAARSPAADAGLAAEVLSGPVHLDERAISLAVTTMAALTRAPSLDLSTPLPASAPTGTQPPTWRAIYAAIHAEAAYHQGDLATAMESAQQALNTLDTKGWGVFVGTPLATAINAATDLERYDVAAELIRLPVPSEMRHTVMGLRYLHARGRYYLSAGRPHEALADFHACDAMMSAWELDLNSVAPWWIDAARAHLQLGWRRTARLLLEAGLSRLTPEDETVRSAALDLLPATSDLTASSDLPAASSDLPAASSLYAAAARHPTPVVPRSRGIGIRRDTATLLVAHPLAVREGELDAGQDPLGTDLSDAELRVARLAASGHTNRQIASKLFVTISTVEQHLTRVYRKLRINGRRDLTPGMVPTGTTGAGPLPARAWHLHGSTALREHDAC